MPSYDACQLRCVDVWLRRTPLHHRISESRWVFEINLGMGTEGQRDGNDHRR